MSPQLKFLVRSKYTDWILAFTHREVFIPVFFFGSAGKKHWMSEINFLIPRLDKDCTEGRNNPFRNECNE